MKNLLLFGFLCTAFLFVSCNDDDAEEMMHDHNETLDYEIHISSPVDGTVFNNGDMMNIKVNVHDHHGNTVHHVKFRIYNEDTNEEIFNEPSDAHVHEETGNYDFETDFLLNVDSHSNWIFEARAWNHDGSYEVSSEPIKLHVHP